MRNNRFLVIDQLPDLERKEADDQLEHGQIDIEESDTEQDDDPIHFPAAWSITGRE